MQEATPNGQRSWNFSPSSYWQRTSQQISFPTDLPTSADVAVIGGGILGVATCYWLARMGVRVVLLERQGLAYGATGRNGGFVAVGLASSYTDIQALLGEQAAESLLKVTIQNQELLRQILAQEEFDCHYREPGILALSLNEVQQRSQAEEVLALQRLASPALMLDRQQTQELIGTTIGPEIIGGKLGIKHGLVHSARLVQGLALAAQRYGARFALAHVVNMVDEQGSVRIQCREGELSVHRVVVAVNAWSDELVPSMAGLITPVRGQMLAYEPLERIFTTGMAASVTETDEYWQQTMDGTIVLGGCRTAAPKWDRNVRQAQPTPEVQSALEQVFPRLFPGLKGLRVAQRWAGLMAFTPDYLPIVDQLPDLPGSWFAGGFSGHGMPFGIRLGQLLATAVTTACSPEEFKPLRRTRPTLRRE